MNDDPWPPDTLPLDPEIFDDIIESMPEIIGIPVYHRGDDRSVVWPRPAEGVT